MTRKFKIGDLVSCYGEGRGNIFEIVDLRRGMAYLMPYFYNGEDVGDNPPDIIGWKSLSQLNKEERTANRTKSKRRKATQDWSSYVDEHWFQLKTGLLELGDLAMNLAEKFYPPEEFHTATDLIYEQMLPRYRQLERQQYDKEMKRYHTKEDYEQWKEWERRRRSVTANSNYERLIAAIERILNQYQSRGVPGEDIFADVRFEEHPDKLVLTYDGAGYDYLSYESGRVGDPLRQEIFQAAEKLGYEPDDINSWSMGFWPEVVTAASNKNKQQLTLLNGYARLLAQCQKIKGGEEACQQQAKKLDDLIASAPDSISDKTINDILEKNGLDSWKLKAAGFNKKVSAVSGRGVLYQIKKLETNLKMINVMSRKLLERVMTEKLAKKWEDSSYRTFYNKGEWANVVDSSKELLNDVYGALLELEATFDYNEIGE